jgi:hypothetical protein
VNISPISRMVSQRARREIRHVEGFETAELLGVFRGLFLDDVDDVVDGHDALHLAVAVDDGDDVEVVLGEHARDRLLIHLVRDADDVGLHDLGDRDLRISAEQVAERHHAEQPLRRIEHVRDVDRLDLGARLPAQIQQRLVGRHLGPQARVARRHQTAGLVLGVREQREHFFARRVVEQREQRDAVGFAGLLDHVGDVVGLEQAHPLPALARPEVQQEVRLIARRERDEELFGVLAWQHAQAVAALLEIEQRPRVAQLVGTELIFHAQVRRAVATLRGDRDRAGRRDVEQLVDLRVIAAALGDGLDLGHHLARLFGRQHRDLAGALLRIDGLGDADGRRDRLGDVLRDRVIVVGGRHRRHPAETDRAWQARRWLKAS